MDIKDILSVGLTAEDFDTLIEGIDAMAENIPLRAFVEDITMSMVIVTMGERAKEEHLQKVKVKVAAMQKKMDAQKEDQTILKSKLILLKRHLLSNEAVRMAQEIVAGGVKFDISQKKPNSLKKLRIYLEGRCSLAKLAF